MYLDKMVFKRADSLKQLFFFAQCANISLQFLFFSNTFFEKVFLFLPISNTCRLFAIENNIAKLITSRIESHIGIDIIDNIILTIREKSSVLIRNSIKRRVRLDLLRLRFAFTCINTIISEFGSNIPSNSYCQSPIVDTRLISRSTCVNCVYLCACMSQA